MTALQTYQQPTYNGTPTTYAPTAITTDPTGGRLIAWANSLHAAHQLAEALCDTAFVPRHFAGKPIEAAAALILGDELGFSPISALRSIFVISGTPGLYAKSMVALVQSHGHEVWTEVDTPTKVVVCGQRRGSAHVERSEWTTERARRAKYTNNAKYESDPQAMLYARAASDVCRKVAADVLAGVPYAVEELELLEPVPVKRVSRAKPDVPVAEEPPLEDAPQTGGAGEVAESAPSADDPAPPDPDTITSSQLKKMGALMREAGITQRQAALEFVGETVDRFIETRNDLTKREASLVIKALERLGQPAVAEPDPTPDPWADPS